MDGDTEHPRLAWRDSDARLEVELTEDEPKEEVVPGEDRDSEVRLCKNSRHPAEVG